MGLNTPLKSICSRNTHKTNFNSFCKVYCLTLISMNGQLLQLLKRTDTNECFHKPATYWKWTPPLTISWKHKNKDGFTVNPESALFQR